MAKNGITKTVGTSEVSVVYGTDIEVLCDSYWVHCPDTNSVDIWVNMDPNGTATAVGGNNHTFVRPGESVPFPELPLKFIASAASQSVTVAKF